MLFVWLRLGLLCDGTPLRGNDGIWFVDCHFGLGLGSRLAGCLHISDLCVTWMRFFATFLPMKIS